MEFVYRRVSTAEQSTARQLPGFPCDREFEDIMSGKDTNRDQLRAMMNMLRSGDVVHVHELSRLGRSVVDLIGLVTEMVDKGVTVRFHKENLTFGGGEKSDPFQTLQLNLLSSLAQFERELMLERQREGIAIAKANGKYKGRKSKFTDAQFDQIRGEFKSLESSGSVTKSKSELARRWGISREYLYRIAKG